MERIKLLFDVFAKVTTCTVFGAAVFCLIFSPGVIFGVEMLWQLLLVSFLTSAGTLMYTDEIKKNSMKIRCIIHYLMVNVIVVVCSLWFGWIEADNLTEVIGMLVLIAIIFLTVSVLSWKKVMKEADLMNARLAEYQEKKEEKNSDK